MTSPDINYAQLQRWQAATRLRKALLGTNNSLSVPAGEIVHGADGVVLYQPRDWGLKGEGRWQARSLWSPL
jgi:hypothetical protein